MSCYNVRLGRASRSIPYRLRLKSVRRSKLSEQTSKHFFDLPAAWETSVTATSAPASHFALHHSPAVSGSHNRFSHKSEGLSCRMRQHTQEHFTSQFLLSEYKSWPTLWIVAMRGSCAVMNGSEDEWQLSSVLQFHWRRNKSHKKKDPQKRLVME